MSKVKGEEMLICKMSKCVYDRSILIPSTSLRLSFSGDTRINCCFFTIHRTIIYKAKSETMWFSFQMTVVEVRMKTAAINLWTIFTCFLPEHARLYIWLIFTRCCTSDNLGWENVVYQSKNHINLSLEKYMTQQEPRRVSHFTTKF